jgi:transglutaminase superfamily protein
MNFARAAATLRVLVGSWPSALARHLFREAWRIERALPEWMDALSLPDLMRRLDDEARKQTLRVDAAMITRLADAAVMLDHFSPLGICLRRSLVRYVLLRRAGVPVVVHFGAKKNVRDSQSKIAGHAWLTLDGQPLAEQPENYQGFTSIYTYPTNPKPQTPSPNARPSITNLQLPKTND